MISRRDARGPLGVAISLFIGKMLTLDAQHKLKSYAYHDKIDHVFKCLAKKRSARKAESKLPRRKRHFVRRTLKLIKLYQRRVIHFLINPAFIPLTRQAEQSAGANQWHSLRRVLLSAPVWQARPSSRPPAQANTKQHTL